MRVTAKQDLFNIGQKQSDGNGDLIGIEPHVVSMMSGWQLRKQGPVVLVDKPGCAQGLQASYGFTWWSFPGPRQALTLHLSGGSKF
jgi:hypothetical protein